jgi:serine/threonine protein phosphatase PrpC
MRAFGMTHRGAVRKENQDCFRLEAPADAEMITAVLCDGMGGAQAGSVASSMAADAFMSHAANSLDPLSSAADMRGILTDAVNYANIKVYDRSFSDFACMGMGSTLVAALMTAKRTVIANVGDSRAYLITGGRAEQITRDHSLVGEMVEKGLITRDEAKSHPKKNIITRAVGVEASVKSDIFELKAVPGSAVLLCSDGISNLITDEELGAMVSGGLSDLESCCAQLLGLAINRGAPDNVTVLLLTRQ